MCVGERGTRSNLGTAAGSPGGKRSLARIAIWHAPEATFGTDLAGRRCIRVTAQLEIVRRTRWGCIGWPFGRPAAVAQIHHW